MSWLFSKAMIDHCESLRFSQEPEVEYSEVICSDGEPSAPLNGSHIQQAYCAPDKMTEFCRLSQYGMTFKPLTESLGEELLMLFLAGFPAKTYPAQEKGQELMEIGAGCGQKWRGSYAKYSPDSRSWKTHQCSFLEGLEEFSETWPRWGLMQSGECWGLEDSERRLSAREYGCWLTTPTCTNMKGTIPSLRFSEGRLPSPACLAKLSGGKPNPEWGEWIMGWPIGWTDQSRLGTDKIQSWQQQHSEFCQVNK